MNKNTSVKRTRLAADTVLICIVGIIALSGLALIVFQLGKDGILINSVVVRARVCQLQSMEARSTIIVGFRVSPKFKSLLNTRINGELYLNDQLVSTDQIFRPDFSGGNLGFDLLLSQGELSRDKPLGIPEGSYCVVITIYSDENRVVARGKKVFSHDRICRRFVGFGQKCAQPTYQEYTDDTARERCEVPVPSADIAENGYMIWQKSYLQRIYPWTIPNPSDRVSHLSVDVSRNESMSVTFSVYAVRNLGEVVVTASPLTGAIGRLKGEIKVEAVRLTTEVVEGDKLNNSGDQVLYRWAPKIIMGRKTAIPEGCLQSFWITITTSKNAISGNYAGSIEIRPQLAEMTTIPIFVKVLPIELCDTDIEYGMMMTYASYELDNIWSDSERRLLESSGSKIYKDIREHGMTMVYPHSHFYLKTDNNGQVVIDSLDADIRCYKKEGFPGPFCWYLGHLLQTAKPFHPGSILNYDEDVAKNRLKQLLEVYEKKATGCGIPKEKLIVQTVDEPDRKDRVAAGKTLNAIAKEMGFKTLVTRPWSEVDIMCTGVPDDDREAEKLRSIGNAWWIYPNEALTTHNLAYTRYVFGFGAWRWGVDGVVPWTYQMSQGCNGNPFTVLDGPEVMVTYPGVNGPITTPTWETIRDGINDYKYIFQLKNLISDGKQSGDPRAMEIEKELEQFKKGLGRAPGTGEYDYGDWPPAVFEKRRAQIVKWALELM